MRFIFSVFCFAFIFLSGFVSAETDDSSRFCYESYMHKLPRVLDLKSYGGIYYHEDKVKRFKKTGEEREVGEERMAKVIETLKKRFHRNKDELDSLMPNEKATIKSIWDKSHDAKISGDVYFEASSVEWQEKNVVTVLNITPIHATFEETLTPADVVIPDICTLTNLTHLNLNFQNITADSFRKLISLKELVCIGVPKNTTDELLLELLNAVPTIKYVDLKGCENITGDFAENNEVAAHLREVVMEGTSLDKDGIINIMTLPSIRMISFDGADIYVDGKIEFKDRRDKGDGAKSTQ